eukprot:scaffold22701_cov123-Cylindrotheca_fusiformis.AAC.8
MWWAWLTRGFIVKTCHGMARLRASWFESRFIVKIVSSRGFAFAFASSRSSVWIRNPDVPESSRNSFSHPI